MALPLVRGAVGSYASAVAEMAAGGPQGEVHGFTQPRTSFVGREAEVSRVADLLAKYRLVTITGPGGVGKTRLADAVARKVAGRFADGTWLAELGSVADPELVAGTVADAVGLRPGPGVPLADVLGRRQLLLVLDNCEHVVDAAASLCESLLVAADDVRVLATSREPLAVEGEARLRLRPLAIPVVRGAPGLVLDAEAETAAMTLFADRARLADTEFVLNATTSPVVREIVARLDGVPLAIELAAARVEGLGLRQLASRLDDGLVLLTRRGRGSAARHTSLAAAADWSYRLVSEREQRIFRALSVFPGPFTLDAADAVAGPEAGSAVLRLVDCSLVVPPRGSSDGRERYLVLETLRAFGYERLVAAGEDFAVLTALVQQATRVAEQAAAGLQPSAAEAASNAWLEAEYATLHHALAWAIKHDHDLAPRLALALAPWWWTRSLMTEGCDLLAAASEGLAIGTDQWCEAQFWLGAMSADVTAAMARMNAVIDTLAARPPVPALARATAALALCLDNLQRDDDAAAAGQRALQLAREVDDEFAAAFALGVLGHVTLKSGDLDEALTWFGRAEALDGLRVPGWLARLCGTQLSRALAAADRPAEAREKCLEVLGSARQAGAAWDEGECLIILADQDVQQGRLPGARQQLRDAFGIYSRTGVVGLLVNLLLQCQYLAIHEQHWREFVTLRAAREAVARRSMQVPVPPLAEGFSAADATATAALSSAEVRAAEERGAAMTPDAAAAYALDMLTDEPATVPGLRLSARERELVVLVAQGRTDAQIAGQLFISVRTVRSHLDRIRDKTGCRRRADLTRLALRAGLI
jgi:predicted ATPase/DNA-binding CsgD family transcriptional regulator